jgi:hypothetical protein
MHGLPTELLDAAVKAFTGAVTTWAITALFKKNLGDARVFSKKT